MTNYTTLITALEAADGPSRELDARIWCAAKGHEFTFIASDFFNIVIESGEGLPVELHSLPAYSSSLDAITALIEREFGQNWCASRNPAYPAYGSVRGDDDLHTEDKAATPALALCIAFLRALQAREAANG